mmetsp:Transcript_16833/g.14732  ORF Transcript_16833/g.14732 Transcript_16833/m.14732 type:complete len:102 (+) Transcript_16833:320-625(+)
MIEILEKYTEDKNSTEKMNILLHSYAGKIESTKRLLKLNANIYFSFSLMASKKPENFDGIPLDNLVLETDSPYQLCEPLLANYFPEYKPIEGVILNVNLEN